MVDLSSYVVMESTSFIPPLHGEIGPSVLHWSSFGQRMANMLLEKALPRLKSSTKRSRYPFQEIRLVKVASYLFVTL